MTEEADNPYSNMTFRQLVNSKYANITVDEYRQLVKDVGLWSRRSCDWHEMARFSGADVGLVQRWASGRKLVPTRVVALLKLKRCFRVIPRSITVLPGCGRTFFYRLMRDAGLQEISMFG
jgi:hypothetical protein